MGVEVDGGGADDYLPLKTDLQPRSVLYTSRANSRLRKKEENLSQLFRGSSRFAADYNNHTCAIVPLMQSCRKCGHHEQVSE